jgi:diadenosine tetraphosphate (Ap4A) HIT family hydrolase
MTGRPLVDLRSARVDEQRRIMEAIVADGRCPFCTEQLSRWHKPRILKESASWVLTPSQWPYDNTRVHLLAILRRHVEDLQGLTPGDFAELGVLMQWAVSEFNVAGGGLCMRFGDMSHSAGSVQHIHAQFIVPDIEKPDFEPVRFKIGLRAS